MTTVTLTDLSRHGARIARLAEHGDVIVTDRGIPRLRISRFDSGSQMERLVAAGLLVPPARQGVVPMASSLDRATARQAIVEFEAERQREY